jgi:hypothetical protein
MKVLDKLLFVAFVMGLVFLSLKGFSQTRQADGSILFPDGKRLLPNGDLVIPDRKMKSGQTILHPKGGNVPVVATNTATTLPDGTVVYPDGTRKAPNGIIVYPNGTIYNPVYERVEPYRGNWLPPGLAKKRYGAQSAREFAPGQQKKHWKEDGKHNDEGHGKGRGHGKGKHDD